MAGNPAGGGALAEAQTLVGQPLDRSHQVWNREVSRDAIWHFCLGIGDDNPLYTDQAYASGSALGELTAPPTFLGSIDSGLVFVGLAGTPTVHIGMEYRWHQRLTLGLSLRADVEYTECREVTGRNAGKLILQTGDSRYYDEHERLIGTVRSTSARVGEPSGRGFNYAPRAYVYSPAEMEAIGRACLEETPRGGTPRLWDDVDVGDRAGPIVKGPLSLVDMTCWYAGGGLHGRRAHRIGWKEVRRNSAHWRRSQSGAFEHIGQGHLDSEGAKEWGMPGPYDNGIQRTAWLGHLVTDWMGDAGFLKALSSKILRPNVFGDTTWLAGTVTDKLVDDDGDHVIGLELVGTNQLDERTTEGTAIVRLPAPGSRLGRA